MLCCKILLYALSRFKYDTVKSLKLFIVVGHVFINRSLEVWGSREALAREKKLRKEAEIEYRESKYIQFKAKVIGKDRHTLEILWGQFQVTTVKQVSQ